MVKLGGSLAFAPALPFWLETLAEHPVIIVPGGGPFADQVRKAQTTILFDDSTAHAMALLAMSQYGLMLTGLNPKLNRAQTLENVRQCAEAGTATVWLPDLSLLEHPDIPHSWDVTSDSLSAWLANQLNIPHLLLVKSTDHTPPNHRLTDWIEAGIVDTALADFMGKTELTVWLGRVSDYGKGSQGLEQPERVWARIEL